MKVSVLQENIMKAVSRATRIVSPKPTLPVLSNLLLCADKGGLSVTAATTETTVTAAAGAKVEKEGGLCVPAKVFSELIATLPQDAVVLEEKEGTLLVSCGGTRASLAGVSAGEFPPVGKGTTKKEMALEKDALVASLALVLFAASSDEGRPLLTGVKVVGGDEGALFAATDGYRLSVYRSRLSFPKTTNAVIPGRALGEILRVCQEEKEEKQAILAETDDGQFVVRVGDTTIVTRTIDGQYPNFEKIIPEKHTTAMMVDKDQLIRAVKSASIFARDSANIVRLHIGKNHLTISANAPQIGENTVEVDAKTEGEEVDIAFNSRFLSDLLGNFPGDEVAFEMTGALNPGAFRSPKDPAFLHIIMPVRTSSG